MTMMKKNLWTRMTVLMCSRLGTACCHHAATTGQEHCNSSWAVLLCSFNAASFLRRLESVAGPSMMAARWVGQCRHLSNASDLLTPVL